MNTLKYLLPLALAGSFSYAQDSNDLELLGPGEVAVVDGKRIPESLLRLYTINTLKLNPDDLTDDEKVGVIERLIYTRLLADEAEKKGLQRERRTAAELELQRMQVLARYMADVFKRDNPPSEAEIREIYEENLEHLEATRYKTRHILVKTKDEAASIIDELDDGEDFIALAREFSSGPAAAQGGDLGWITLDSVPEAFRDAIVATSLGGHYPSPVETEFGWHVIGVDDVEEQEAPSMEEIRQDLITAAESRKLSDYAQGLRDAAEVEILD